MTMRSRANAVLVRSQTTSHTQATRSSHVHTQSSDRLQASAEQQQQQDAPVTSQVNPGTRPAEASSSSSSHHPHQPSKAPTHRVMTMEETSLEQRRAGYVGRGLIELTLEGGGKGGGRALP